MASSSSSEDDRTETETFNLDCPPLENRQCEKPESLPFDRTISTIMKSSLLLSPVLRNAPGNSVPSAKRKLSYILPDEEDKHINIVQIGMESEREKQEEEKESMHPYTGDALAGRYRMVDRYLLYKYAWKLLRQLYINSSARYMRILVNDISDKRREQKLFSTLRARTEFTKRRILGIYIGELKILKRSWCLFFSKFVAYRQEMTFNLNAKRIVDSYYLQKEGYKVFSLLRKKVLYQQTIDRPTSDYFEVRSLRNALFSLRCHAHACRGDIREDAREYGGEGHSRVDGVGDRGGLPSHEGRSAKRRSGHYCSLRETRVIDTAERFCVSRDQLIDSTHYLNASYAQRGIRVLLDAVASNREKRDFEEFAVNYHAEQGVVNVMRIWLRLRDENIKEDERMIVACSHAYLNMKKKAVLFWVKAKSSLSNIRSLDNSSTCRFNGNTIQKSMRKWRSLYSTVKSQYSNYTRGKAHCLSKGFEKFKSKIDKHKIYDLTKNSTIRMKLLAFRVSKCWMVLTATVRRRALRRKNRIAALKFRDRSLLRRTFEVFSSMVSGSVAALQYVRNNIIVRYQRRIIRYLYDNKVGRADGRKRNLLLSAHAVKKSMLRIFQFLQKLAEAAAKARETKKRIRSNERRQSEIFFEVAAVAQMERARAHRHSHHLATTFQEWLALTDERNRKKRTLEGVIRTCASSLLEKSFRYISWRLRCLINLKERQTIANIAMSGRSTREGFQNFLRLHSLVQAVKVGDKCYFLRTCGQAFCSWRHFARLQSDDELQRYGGTRSPTLKVNFVGLSRSEFLGLPF